MVATDGLGDGIGALVCICTACARCTATTRAIGAACVHIGICGVATIIISDLDGSGDVTVVLPVICTASASCVAGLAQSGTTYEATGICGARTTTIIVCTVARSGGGADTGALVCTFTACALSIEITKAIGAG
jgi:hypothetical protein